MYMTKCKHANKYKGIRAPKCGCTFCNNIWKDKQIKSIVNKFLPRLAKALYTVPDNTDNVIIDE